MRRLLVVAGVLILLAGIATAYYASRHRFGGSVLGTSIEFDPTATVPAPSRPAGTMARIASRCFSLSLSVMAVATNPGAMQLAVTPRRAYSWARDFRNSFLPPQARPDGKRKRLLCGATWSGRSPWEACWWARPTR